MKFYNFPPFFVIFYDFSDNILINSAVYKVSKYFLKLFFTFLI